MSQHQRVYLALISQADPLFSKENFAVYSQKALEQLKPITSEALSELYVESAFLQTFVDFLKEQHWIYQKQNPKEELLFQSFVTPYLQLELSPRNYLHRFLELATVKNLKSIKEKAYLLELVLLKIILERSYDEQKSFSKHVLNSLSGMMARRPSGLHKWNSWSAWWLWFHDPE